MLKIVIFLVISLLSIGLAGCGGGVKNSNTAANNTVTANANTERTPETIKNDAPTLSPVLRAYCEAWQKDDEAALRKVYSSETLKIFDAQMKEDKIKSLIKFLEFEKPTGNPCRAANEEITGDKGLATIFLNKYPKGLTVEFVKENGEWKMTNKGPALTSVTESAANANTAK